ncbi:MAG: phosphate signaling complex protein PhoU [Methanomassiliicoccaceae archaeon]|nr:phosphate signaling complex protein PhoU [Methanomassiliicoccaceae archaeon]
MNRLSSDIKKMTAAITEMGELAVEMLEKSVSSLINSDVEAAEEVRVTKYERIAFLESLIEDEALRILILYQPMASDMRLTAAALKLITYLERIGKYSKNIAKAAIYLKDRPTTYYMDDVYAMCDVAVEMVKGVVNAFATKDVSHLYNYEELDDKLDSYRRSVIDENVERMMNNSKSVEACTYYISIAKYLERVGDNACKIAEKIIYMVTGKRVEIDRTVRGL